MTRQWLGLTVSHETLVTQKRLGSVAAVVLDNGSLRLTAVPELGGKIASLVRLESGYEYFLQPSYPERAYRRRSWGDPFEEYEPCGFDECMPTIAECLYPEEPFLSTQLPDHGDIWCLPSDIQVVGDQITLTTFLRSLPLRLTKTVHLQENTVRLDYEATNLSQSTVKFLWSAHPLLRVESGTEIVLPREVEGAEVSWSTNGRMGKSGERCSWPLAPDRDGRLVELNRVVSPTAGNAEKLFTSRLSEGFCRISLPSANESIAFHFNPESVPFLGIWICQGGWPPRRSDKQFAVALEPCSGRPDSLADAIRRNECMTLAAYETARWWMEIEVNGDLPRRLGGMK